MSVRFSAVAALVVALLGTASPARAATPAAASAPAAVPGDHARIAPELAGVTVEGARYRTAAAGYEAARQRYTDALAVRIDAEAQLVQLTAADADLTTRVAGTTSERKVIAGDLARLRTAVRAIAVRAYINITGGSDLESLDVTRKTEEDGHAVIVQSADEHARGEEARAVRDLEHITAALNALLDERAGVRQKIGEQTARRDKAAAEQNAAVVDVLQRQVEYEDARALATVRGTDGMTLVAMDAYWRAAETLKVTEPRCGIPWWAVAGIGQVESHHGTYLGTRLDLLGDTTPRIIGVALNGTDGTATIGDTDGGAIDGDPVYDRAVGPMQFIPSTWRYWGEDGDGDGRKDPDNIYDAALAAGMYLCHSGRLTDDGALTSAYLSYNQSDVYAAEVLSFAHRYEQLDIPPPPDPFSPVPAS
jgi:membrane-bound lytic murein transglycosylase B